MTPIFFVRENWRSLSVGSIREWTLFATPVSRSPTRRTNFTSAGSGVDITTTCRPRKYSAAAGRHDDRPPIRHVPSRPRERIRSARLGDEAAEARQGDASLPEAPPPGVPELDPGLLAAPAGVGVGELAATEAVEGRPDLVVEDIRSGQVDDRCGLARRGRRTTGPGRERRSRRAIEGGGHGVVSLVEVAGVVVRWLKRPGVVCRVVEWSKWPRVVVEWSR
jgi:hypothetical protein